MTGKSWSTGDIGRFYFKLIDRPGEANADGPGNKPAALLTVPEACAVLRISKWGLYRLINSRQLKTIRIGSRRLVPYDAVVAFISELGQEEFF